MNHTRNNGFSRSVGALMFLALVLVAAIACYVVWGPHLPASSAFVDAMNVGKNYLDKGEAAKAVTAFRKAVEINPSDLDAQLNLANSYLQAGQPDQALAHAEEALKIDHDSAAAYYVAGLANLRQGQFQAAVQALQQCVKLDPTIPAVHFQLGLAEEGLKNWNDALTCYQLTTNLQTNHPVAHYKLSQALLRVGKPTEAAEEVAKHQVIAAQAGQINPSILEQCKYTQARVPFQLEQPARQEIPVRFVDATSEAFAKAGANDGFHGPVGVLDLQHDGHNGIFVGEGADGFRLLTNDHGSFRPSGAKIPATPGAHFSRCLIGDLNRDRSEDIILLGPQETRVFKTTTNNILTDVSAFSRLRSLSGTDGGLADFDFTGKLDLAAITSTNSLHLFRILSGFLFREITATSGVPSTLSTARQLIIDDWNNDDLLDLIVGQKEGPPLLFLKQRGGSFALTNFSVPMPKGILAVGDINNDLRNDLVIATAADIECFFGGTSNHIQFPHGMKGIRTLTLVDYDNDGWLDIIAAGDGLKIWRNTGLSGFKDMTQPLGLDAFRAWQIDSVTAADFDQDGDTDLLISLAQNPARPGPLGLRLLRNDGGNANLQLKVLPLGNRSNPSGIGVRIEIAAGGLRLIRTVSQLPVEIGVGQHRQVDSVTLRWFDLAVPTVDVKVEPTNLFTSMEIVLPTGSCPNLYAWNGKNFDFVTDILGASPLGLPATESHYIEADTDEYVRIGDEQSFPPRGSNYVVQITEELREVLYLDEAKLVAVDHPPGTEVFSMDKLVPGKPFPPSGIITLEREHPLLKATLPDGSDVTKLLQRADGRLLSPPRLRVPQLRGLAEPHSVILDFGPLPVERPLVLAMTGWLRFGGGMANIAAAQEPDLPFPFPSLEAELPDHSWKTVDVVVGAPAGKTKGIVVDLTGKLPAGSRRLRLSEAFEIHWDRIALMEKTDPNRTRLTALAPTSTDLHWRGFSEYKPLPPNQPLTPDYGKVHANPMWRITPMGWCTRYGPVDELVAKSDDALVLLNGGDELTLSFNSSQLPPKPPGYQRDFFIYAVGWDKDADFHVALGSTVEPLPFHGLDDQQYGHPQPPRAHVDQSWIQRYNTRWVGPWTLHLSER